MPWWGTGAITQRGTVPCGRPAGVPTEVGSLPAENRSKPPIINATARPAAIATTIFYVLYQQFENYILVPRVMKKTVDVSPLTTIIAALLGGALLGIVGALVAIPIAAAVQLMAQEVFVPRQDGR